MRTRRTAGLALAIVLLWVGLSDPQTFGRNKVKYDQFDWSYVSTEHFDIYFYGRADRLARRAAYIAEQAYAQLRQDFGYDLKARIPIIIYISHNDFEQTNIIMELIEEEVGGFTEYFKNRVVVPFEGSWSKFRHVVHHELTHAVCFDMLYGNMLESLLSRQYLFQLPLWFAEGLAEYESLPWDAECDMFMRDAVISDYLPPIDQMYGGFMVYKGGQAIFRYMAEAYGRDKIGQLLRRIAASKNVEQSVRLVTGLGLKEFSRKWQKAMRKTYWPEVGQREEAEDFAKRLTDHKAEYSYLNHAPAFSPQGDKIAFLSDKNDYKGIYLMSAIDGRLIKKLMQGETEGGFEEMHWQRGAITWSPDGQKIAFATKSGARDVLYIQRVKDTAIEKRWSFDLDAIFSPDWSPDGTHIVFVGLRDGASDLYMVELATSKLRRITNDPFDETSPQWSPDGARIAFASDRASSQDTLRLDALPDAYNIWTIRPDGTDLTSIVTDPSDERAPTWSPDGQHIAFISDRNGIYNLYVVDLDSLHSYPITNTLTGCFSPDWSPDGKKLAFVSFQNAGWDIFVLKDPLAQAETAPLGQVAFRASKADTASQTIKATVSSFTDMFADTLANISTDREVALSIASKADTVAGTEAEIASFESSGDLPAEGRGESRAAIGRSYDVSDIVSPIDIDSLPVRRYTLRFSPDVIYAAAGYSSYSGLGGQVLISVSDIMGNHRCMLYTNLFYSLQDSDFLFIYYYLRRRTDYGLGIFQSKEYYVTGDYQWFSDRTYGGALLLSRPFTKFTRVDFDLLITAIDRDYYWSSTPRERTRAILPVLSLVNDTILWGMTGPVNGARSMISVEYCPDIGVNSFSFCTTTFDARKYVRLQKKYTFVARVSGGLSVGANPPRFFVGGTENWLGPKFARTDVWDVQDIYFAKFPAPLRGTRYYELSGTRYALLNLEFRYPFIRQFVTSWPISIFLRDVGGALFLDAGSAWSEDNAFKGIRVAANGVPHLHSLKASYGFGARVNLGIAILRFDAAWRTDLASTSAKPRYYFSLGSEF